MKTVIIGLVDNSKIFALSAQWSAYKKFNQNIKETYKISVVSPESVARYGTIPTAQSYGYTSTDQKYTNWADDTNIGAGALIVDGDTDRATFENTYSCALHKAQTQILKSHRRNKINFQIPLLPSIELKHTASLTGKWIRGKGKVSAITHYMGISDTSSAVGGEAYSDITLLQYRGNASVSDTPLVVPTKPSDDMSAPSLGVILDNHLGKDPSVPEAAKWNGLVGNVFLYTPQNIYKTNYQESFTVAAPVIPTNYTNNKSITSTPFYNVNIPNDTTVYQSYG